MHVCGGEYTYVRGCGGVAILEVSITDKIIFNLQDRNQLYTVVQPVSGDTSAGKDRCVRGSCRNLKQVSNKPAL